MCQRNAKKRMQKEVKSLDEEEDKVTYAWTYGGRSLTSSMKPS